MSGKCDNCAKRNECSKPIGIIWGFCNTDYEEEKDDGSNSDIR